MQIFQTPHIPVLLPRGDIHVEVGSPQFTISCHLNPENKYYRDGHRSDRLGIYATDERNNQRQLKSRIVNSTTIEAVYNPAERGEELVKCKIDLPGDGYKGICTQIIFVGGEFLVPVHNHYLKITLINMLSLRLHILSIYCQNSSPMSGCKIY